jgi:hypothetical protein
VQQVHPVYREQLDLLATLDQLVLEVLTEILVRLAQLA